MNTPKNRNVWNVALVSIAGLMAFALLATELSKLFWLFDLMANLRVQQVIAVSTFLAITVYRRQPAAIVILVVVLIAHLRWFGNAIPSTTHVTKVQSTYTTIKISFANVLTSNSRHDEAIAELLEPDPDVFAVLEISHALAEKLVELTLDRYPDPVLRPSDDGNFGIALYSKHPMQDVEVFQFDDGIDSISATIQFPGRPFRILATHPLPPIGKDLSFRRNEHLRQVADRILEFRRREPSIPVVLVGDLNLTPWSPIFEDLMDKTRLHRGIANVNVTPTYYSSFPLFPFGLVIDHALIDESLECSEYLVGPDFGSDHRRVTVHLE